jgi:FMN phosphatase YigB (HAD superfamily)
MIRPFATMDPAPSAGSARHALATFDVFDTVLVRVTGSPEAAFLLLGKRAAAAGLVNCTPEVFARARYEAQHRAYRGRTKEEVELADIHRELAATLGLPAAAAERLAALECEVESGLLRKVPRGVSRVEDARSRGIPVAFVSDMYLPAGFVREQLVRHGLIRDGEACFVSSEVQRVKRNGSLFRHVAEARGVRLDSIVHCGNDAGSDVREARRAGVDVAPFDDANVNRYERLLDEHRWATSGAASVFAGTARLTRLSNEAKTPEDAALWNVAAGVVAPTLVSFVLWVLSTAQRRGSRRVCFLSRDGQVLAKIARVLADRARLPLDVSYLYASRHCWNFAGVGDASERDLWWIWDKTDAMTVPIVLARARLEPDEVAAELEAAGLPRARWKEPLDDAGVEKLRAVLRDARVRGIVAQRAAQARALLVRYLEQEGLLAEDSRWTLVDVGWRGSMQDAVLRVLDMIGRKDAAPSGLYFGLLRYGADRERAAGPPPGEREAFFVDEYREVGMRGAVDRLIAIMEMFCAADHGTLVDLREDAGRIVPVLAEEVNAELVAWGLRTVHASACRFAELLPLDDGLVDWSADLRPAVADVIRAFRMSPEEAEARMWTQFPWEDGLGGATTKNRIGRSFGWGDVLRAVWTGEYEAHRRGLWAEGCLAVSPAPVRRSMQAAVRAGRTWRGAARRVRDVVAPRPRTP